MNIIKRYAATGLATLAILVAITVGTSADESEDGPKGPKFNPENHQAVMEAVEQCDYDAWYNLVSQDKWGSKILDVINEDNFPRFCEIHQLMAEAKAIAEELGLPALGHGPMGKQGLGHRGGSPDSTDKHPALTDKQKAVMEQVRELMKAGDKEGAKELLEEAGIQFPKMRMMNRGFSQKGQNQE